MSLSLRSLRGVIAEIYWFKVEKAEVMEDIHIIVEGKESWHEDGKEGKGGFYSSFTSLTLINSLEQALAY